MGMTITEKILARASGKEALGEATVKIRTDSRTFVGRGISTDIIEASAKAYMDAISRMVGEGGTEEPGAKAEL